MLTNSYVWVLHPFWRCMFGGVMDLVFTPMLSERYRRQLRSHLLCPLSFECYFVCWFCCYLCLFLSVLTAMFDIVCGCIIYQNCSAVVFFSTIAHFSLWVCYLICISSGFLTKQDSGFFTHECSLDLMTTHLFIGLFDCWIQKHTSEINEMHRN